MSLHRKRVKRLKLKQILILILRMLIIVLLALALARPIITSKWALAAGGRARASVVIVLDNSYSMSYERYDGSRFDIAKDKALRLLKSLRPGDDASLILMSDLPDVVFKRLASDIGQVREAIKNAQVSHKGSHVWPSIWEAYGLLKESDHPYKAIYLISDLGENGWRDWKNMPDAPEMVDIFVIRIGEAEADNRAIESVLLSNEPVGMGMPVQIKAMWESVPALDSTYRDQEVAATEVASSEVAATVELFVDGEKRGQAVASQAGMPVPLSFTHVFKYPGTHVGEIHLTPDRLPLDDVRYFAVDVLGQIKVLCAGEISNLSLQYVNLALNPVTSLNPEEEFLILPIGCTVEELGMLSLDQYSVVVLVDVAELPEDTVRDLIDFAVRGGNIVIFLGETANNDWYNVNFNSVPATLGDRMSFSKSPLKLSKWDTDHPIFKTFDDESTPATFADSLEFYSAFSMKLRTDAKVIASFDRDIPAILESEEGGGRVILFNTSPDTEVSNLALDPAFLPLMQQTIFYLASRVRESNRNILVGDTYVQAVQEGVDSPPSVFDPEGSSATPVLSAFRGRHAIHYGPVERAGIYKLEFKSEGILRRDYFAVNLDTTDESDLKAAKDEEVIGKLGERARFVSLDDSPVGVGFSPARTGSEISSRLLIAAAILMLVEIPLANRRRV